MCGSVGRRRNKIKAIQRSLDGLFLFQLLQDPFAVDDCGDEDFVLLESINDSIAVGQQLADILVIEFRDLAAGTWELLEQSGLLDDVFDHDGCVGRRIFGDGLKVLERAARPDYSVSHRLRRISTSCCDRVPLRRASSKPRRTLSRT